MYVADLAAPGAEQLIIKRAIAMLVPERDGERPRWLGTAQGVAKLADPG